MCRPTHFGVDYEINPWMDKARQPDRSRALSQWEALRRTLEKEMGVEVELCPSRPGLPDMTFTANAGLVSGDTFIPARFRHEERAGEEPHFASWFRRRGYRLAALPEGYRFEGEGDALFLGRKLFAGYYIRSDIQTHEAIGRILDVQVLSLALVNEYFYHLDTCFAPVAEGCAVYYPPAFDRYSLRVLRQNVDDLIAVSEAEARRLCCNMVVVGRNAVVPAPCEEVARELEGRGLTVYPLDIGEFLKAGGAAKCLTLRLR
jgi:N-dimethylarginine dimethylaminohydrolase